MWWQYYCLSPVSFHPLDCDSWWSALFKELKKSFFKKHNSPTDPYRSLNTTPHHLESTVMLKSTCKLGDFTSGWFVSVRKDNWKREKKGINCVTRSDTSRGTWTNLHVYCVSPDWWNVHLTPGVSHALLPFELFHFWFLVHFWWPGCFSMQPPALNALLLYLSCCTVCVRKLSASPPPYPTRKSVWALELSNIVQVQFTRQIN